MADHAVTLERDDEQPQELQQLHKSFDLTKRFHIVFTSFKLLVIAHFNSQHIGILNYKVLQFYIICEVIYFIALIKVTGPASPNSIYQYLYIIFGTLGSELLLWSSLSLILWLIINISLLVFALVCLLTRDPSRFQKIIELFNNILFSEV